MTDRRILLLVNPRSGRRRGTAILEQVKPVFAAADVELDVQVTEQGGHARRIAKEFDLSGYGGLCLIGGDGTLHEIVSGLFERSEWSEWGEPAAIPLGIIPSGTGNDVARQLEIAGPLNAAERIIAGRTVPFDVARVEAGDQTDYCVTLVGWTGVADINCLAERLRILGRFRYAAATLWHILFPKRRHAELVLDDRRLEGDFMLVIAANTVFSGSGMRVAPRADTADGKIDVVILRNASRRQLLRTFAKVFDGSYVDLPFVEYYQVRSLRILSDESAPLDLDGEVWGTAPVKVEVIPKAVRFFV